MLAWIDQWQNRDRRETNAGGCFAFRVFAFRGGLDENMIIRPARKQSSSSLPCIIRDPRQGENKQAHELDMPADGKVRIGATLASLRKHTQKNEYNCT